MRLALELYWRNVVFQVPEFPISVQLGRRASAHETSLSKSLRSLLLAMVAKIIGNWAFLYMTLSMMGCYLLNSLRNHTSVDFVSLIYSSVLFILSVTYT